MKYTGTYKDQSLASPENVVVRPYTGDRAYYDYEYWYSHWTESHRWQPVREEMVEYYVKIGTWKRTAQLPDAADIEDDE